MAEQLWEDMSGCRNQESVGLRTVANESGNEASVHPADTWLVHSGLLQSHFVQAVNTFHVFLEKFEPTSDHSFIYICRFG